MIVCCALLLLSLAADDDGPPVVPALVVPAEEPYLNFDLWDVPRPTHGPSSLQVLGGHYVLVNAEGARLGIRRDGTYGWLNFDYDLATIRVESVVSPNFKQGTWLEGYGSLLFDLTYGSITRDFGSYFAGPSILGRYTFAYDRWRLHPYLQGGVGFVITDAHHDLGQRLIGGNFEFLLQLQGGVQFLIGERWSIDVEGGLQHISNASTQHRNVGVNDLGAQVGVTYRFGR